MIQKWDRLLVEKENFENGAIVKAQSIYNCQIIVLAIVYSSSKENLRKSLYRRFIFVLAKCAEFISYFPSADNLKRLKLVMNINSSDTFLFTVGSK